jgi:hypothetical protein
MIEINYKDKEIKVDTQNVSKIFELPLKLSIHNHVTKKEIWHCELGDYQWASFPNKEMYDTVISDNQGRIIVRKNWDVINDGDYLYKSIYLYCLNLIRNGINPNGLAVGTHDGDFGEWVPLVLHGISRATLVEASKPQFEKLEYNYNGYDGVKLINELVTTDGKPVEFFEGGKGYTNTVVPRVIHSWEKDPISSSLKESTNINYIINQMDRFDWLHLDVEGYDTTLIMGINPSKLPRLIIFERNNLLPEEESKIDKYLTDFGYSLHKEPVSTLAII